MVKKVLTWGGLAFLIFFIAFRPASAAEVFKSIGAASWTSPRASATSSPASSPDRIRMAPMIPEPGEEPDDETSGLSHRARHRADTRAYSAGPVRRHRRFDDVEFAGSEREPGRARVRPRRPHRHPASRVTWSPATCSRPSGSAASGAGTGSTSSSGSHRRRGHVRPRLPGRLLRQAGRRPAITVAVLVWLGVMGWVLWDVADWYFDRFILTNKRVMVVKGIITRKVAMMPLLRVTDMKYEQSPLGRVLGYGTFVLESAGQDQALREVKNLPNPNELYLRVVEEMYEPEAAEARRRTELETTDDGP